MSINIVINIIIALFSFIIGNRLAIGRDKRKEFNCVAEIINVALVKRDLEKDKLLPNIWTYKNRFGSWEQSLKKAGLLKIYQ